MHSNLNLIFMLLFVCILELPKAVVCDDSIKLLSTGWDVRCKLQPNSVNCLKKDESVLHRFYYDTKMQNCKSFEYRGCSLNFNSFTMLTECTTACGVIGTKVIAANEMKNLSMEVICRLQPEFGTCFGYHPMYYYDFATRSCKGFSYSGCGGNRNRFAGQYDCLSACESVMPNLSWSSIKF